MTQRIFISYAHADYDFLLRLQKHLGGLQHNKIISIFDDRSIVPGSKWHDEIRNELEYADLILFLVSPDFLGSGYIQSVEVDRAIARYRANQVQMVPILIRPCTLQGTPLAQIQALPRDLRPVTEWPDIDAAFREIAESLHHIIQHSPKMPADTYRAGEQISSREIIQAADKIPKRKQSASKTVAVDPIVDQKIKYDWGDAPNSTNFVGRSEEYGRVRSWIFDESVSVVGLLGIGGIGKTALAARIASSSESGIYFDRVFWRSLRNAPKLVDLLVEALQFLSNEAYASIDKSIDQIFSDLAGIMTAKKCLIVLDNFESILASQKAGHFLNDYEAYGKLVEFLGDSNHNSTLLFTGREKPHELSMLESVHGRVRSIELDGLSTKDGQSILELKGVSGSDEDLAKLISTYSGNPLALKIISEMIREVYHGEIVDLIRDGQPIFDEIQNIIEEQFNRLSPLECSIVYWLAIEREPISREVLSDSLSGHTSKRELAIALQALRRRSLIEQTESGFTLQNVIMEFASNEFTKIISEEISSNTLLFLNSHCLIKAEAADFIRQSQIRMILEPISRELIRMFETENTVLEHLKHLCEMLKTKQETRQGYAAGSIINILIHLQFDLRFFDFSTLTIRQACLQNTQLCRVDFQNCEFSGSTFLETFSGVVCVSISPDGSLLAVGSNDAKIRVWSLDDGEQLFTLEGHTSGVWDLAFNSTSKLLVSGGNDCAIRIWSVSDQRCIRSIEEHKKWVRSVDFCQNDRVIVSGSADRTIRFWDVGDWNCIRTIEAHEDEITTIAVSNKKNIVASGSSDSTIAIWDVKSGKLIRRFNECSGRVECVAFHPITDSIAIAGADGKITVVDMENDQTNFVLEGHTDVVSSLSFSPDGKFLVSSGFDKTVRLWDITSKQCLRILSGHSRWVRSVKYHPSHELIASGSDDQTVRLYDSKRGHCLKTFRGYNNPILTVAVQPNEKLFASGSDDGLVRLWDLDTNECIATLDGHTARVWLVTFSKDGKYLASSSDDNTIVIWDMEKHSFRTRIPKIGTVPLKPLVFNSLGSAVFSSAGKSIVMLDIRNGNLAKEYIAEDRIWSVACSPDEKMVVGGCADGHLYVWDCASGRLLRKLTGHVGHADAIVFSSDGMLLASAGTDRTIRLWNLLDDSSAQIFEGHEDVVTSVSFNHADTRLVSGSVDTTVRVWSVPTGECLHTFNCHESVVWDVRFLGSTGEIVTCSEDETIRVMRQDQAEATRTFRIPRPYERMNISNVSGLTPARIESLKSLGAIIR